MSLEICRSPRRSFLKLPMLGIWTWWARHSTLAAPISLMEMPNASWKGNSSQALSMRAARQGFRLASRVSAARSESKVFFTQSFVSQPSLAAWLDCFSSQGFTQFGTGGSDYPVA